MAASFMFPLTDGNNFIAPIQLRPRGDGDPLVTPDQVLALRLQEVRVAASKFIGTERLPNSWGWRGPQEASRFLRGPSGQLAAFLSTLAERWDARTEILMLRSAVWATGTVDDGASIGGVQGWDAKLPAFLSDQNAILLLAPLANWEAGPSAVRSDSISVVPVPSLKGFVSSRREGSLGWPRKVVVPVAPADAPALVDALFARGDLSPLDVLPSGLLRDAERDVVRALREAAQSPAPIERARALESTLILLRSILCTAGWDGTPESFLLDGLYWAEREGLVADVGEDLMVVAGSHQLGFRAWDDVVRGQSVVHCALECARQLVDALAEQKEEKQNDVWAAVETRYRVEAYAPRVEAIATLLTLEERLMKMEGLSPAEIRAQVKDLATELDRGSFALRDRTLADSRARTVDRMPRAFADHAIDVVALFSGLLDFSEGHGWVNALRLTAELVSIEIMTKNHAQKLGMVTLIHRLLGRVVLLRKRARR